MGVHIEWAELDTLATPFHVAVSHAELDVQGIPFSVCVGWAELDCLAPAQQVEQPGGSAGGARKKKRHTLSFEDGKYIAKVEAVSEDEEEEIIMAVLLEVANHVLF